MQRTIIGAKFELDLCRHMTSQGPYELKHQRSWL